MVAVVAGRREQRSAKYPRRLRSWRNALPGARSRRRSSRRSVRLFPDHGKSALFRRREESLLLTLAITPPYGRHPLCRGRLRLLDQPELALDCPGLFNTARQRLAIVCVYADRPLKVVGKRSP